MSNLRIKNRKEKNNIKLYAFFYHRSQSNSIMDLDFCHHQSNSLYICAQFFFSAIEHIHLMIFLYLP